MIWLELHSMFKLRSLPVMLPALDLQQPYDSSSDARIISNHFRIPESKTQEWHSLNMLRGWYYLISLPGRYRHVVSIGSSHTNLVSSLIWGSVYSRAPAWYPPNMEHTDRSYINIRTIAKTSSLMITQVLGCLSFKRTVVKREWSKSWIDYNMIELTI
jgi:hypothetical protein